MYRNKLHEKLKESLRAVLPIVGIVLFLSFTIAPFPPSILMAFLIGSVFLIVGMMFFSLGSELSMAPMGERLGACITRTKKLAFILPLGFLLGFMVTISEPDLQVLADQVKDIPSVVLIMTVAVGVGLFLVVALLRMLFSVSLPRMLTVFYLLIFVLAAFAPENILAVAFDSGGVTTGPMTVPFIMGYSDMVMDAAHKGGAGGGAVLHAKGSGMEKAEHFMGISLAAEKDVIFIVAKTEKKNDIMRSIMKEAGVESKAGSILFSLPVTDTAGLRFADDD